ncbi:MAG: hypothetical protein KAR38_03215, partial [Calditrichia bacterium]|nr:hypothetical protein [Calditrichia bacterium]
MKKYFKKHRFSYIILFSFFVSTGYGQLYQESFGGTLRIGMVKKDLIHFNPYNANSVLDQMISDLAFKGCLFKTNEQGDVEPVFVNNYKKITKKVWNFTLKRSLYFQGGKPILSKDIRSTLLYLKATEPVFLKKKLELSNIKHISILGALSFQIVLEKEDKNLIKKIADIPIIPANYIENMMSPNTASQIKILSGSGPFSVSQVNNYSEIYFKAHKNFYRGRPFLNNIHIKFFNNQQQKISSYIKGDLDLVYFNDYATAKAINQFTGKNSLIYEVNKEFPQLYMILLNQNNPLFKNRINRRALEFAINKKNLFVQSIKVEQRSFFFSEKSSYYNSLIGSRKYDPLKALSILKANGWQLGPNSRVLKKQKLEFNFPLFFDRGSTLQENAVRNIQIQLAEIGINVVPVPVDPLEKLDLLLSGNYSAMIVDSPVNENNPLPLYLNIYNKFLRKQFVNLNIFSRQVNSLNNRINK